MQEADEPGLSLQSVVFPSDCDHWTRDFRGYIPAWPIFVSVDGSVTRELAYHWYNNVPLMQQQVAEVHPALCKKVPLSTCFRPISCYFHRALCGSILQALVKGSSVLTLIYHLHDFVNLSNIPFIHILSNWSPNPSFFLCKVTSTAPQSL